MTTPRDAVVRELHDVYCSCANYMRHLPADEVAAHLGRCPTFQRTVAVFAAGRAAERAIALAALDDEMKNYDSPLPRLALSRVHRELFDRAAHVPEVVGDRLPGDTKEGQE